ncbi:hypothetical protein [Bradyrhizobium sp.]|uniref:hypothetical protein n=1 Tax=Bradyrhizobium sp. TaxID=376 RepID=UPI004037C1E8
MTANTSHESSDLEWLFQKVEIVRSAWKLVLVSFLTLSILGCGALFVTMRPAYTSQMVLPLTPHLQALIYTDAIQGPVVRKIRSTGETDMTEERQRLAARLVVSELTKGSGLFSISVKDPSPQGAQAILDHILAQIVDVSKPSGTNLANAQQQLESYKRALIEMKGLAATLKENASRAKGGSEGESYARSFALLVSDIAAKEQRIFELQSYLAGFRIEDVAVPPTLVSRTSIWPSRELAVILLASLVLPISFVLLSDRWRKRLRSKDSASNLPRSA